MGKKDKKDKKHKGIEKTAMKTEKNLEKKTKKLLKEKGEEDIESMIAQFQEQDRKRQQVVEEKCSPPSLRSSMTLTPHPEKDVLMMFGGEYFDGSKTFLYNDLYFYHIKSNEWSLLKAPNAPAPRCAHQAVALHQCGGQLWIFGGEFSNPSQTQFYHYKDLWVLNLKDSTWEKVTASGGPSARSGHRMVACQKMLFVFGGFHESTNDYKYFNDLHAFNVETYKWIKLEISGIPPSPRSACVIAVTHEQNRIIVYGGYSKERIKRDVDRGQVHTDMFALTHDNKQKDEASVSDKLKLKWLPLKQTGSRPSPRSSCSLVVTSPNSAMIFGGVIDEEEDEELLTGIFFNDMYSIELDKARWHQVTLRKSTTDTEPKKRRRKEKLAAEAQASAEGDEASSDGEDDEAMDISEVNQDVKNLTIAEDPENSVTETPKSVTTFDDGIFTVTISGQPQGTSDMSTEAGVSTTSVATDSFMPCPRMNPMLAVKSGTLFLYGGMFEHGDRQVTLSDFYSLDLRRMDEWKTLIPLDVETQAWFDSESSSGEDEDETAVEGATGGSIATKNDEEDADKSSSSDDEDDD